MYVGLTYLAISIFTLVSTKVTDDDDMLLFWRRSSSSKCEPFTSYYLSCNKCVCSADGTEFCTKMACFKGPMFLTDESSKVTPINDFNRPNTDTEEVSSV